MRHIISIIIAVFIASMGLANGQDKNTKSYTRQGDTFVQGKTSRGSSSDQATAYTWKDSKGNEYPLFLHEYTKDTKNHKQGDVTCFVYKTSAKTGKEYKYYIPEGEAIAKEILKENL